MTLSVAASAHVAGVTERVPTGLRPDAETVRSGADRYASEQPSVRRADRVDNTVVASGQPEQFPIRRHVAHVRTSTAGNAPLGHDPARAERDHGDRALTAVRNVEVARIATRIETVRATTRGDEPQHTKTSAVHKPNTVP